MIKKMSDDRLSDLVESTRAAHEIMIEKHVELLVSLLLEYEKFSPERVSEEVNQYLRRCTMMAIDEFTLD